MATAEEYAAALKQVTAAQKKKDPGYLLVSFDYKELILPFEAGQQLLAALQQAELLDRGYTHNPPKLNRLREGDFVFRFLSQEQYEDLHMAELMQLPLSDIQEMRKNGGQPSTPPPF